MSYPPSKTKPWQHQENAWEKARDKSAFYIAHDMGAGKSKLGVDMTNIINPDLVLIICPAKVIPVWPGQFRIHSYNENFTPLALVKGSVSTKAKKIKDYISHCQKIQLPAIIIVNYEAIIRPPLGPTFYEKTPRIQSPGLLLQYKWDLLICDEAHRIKAPNGKISWQTARIARKAKRRLFLSGTPMAHSPLDIYAQFRALDPRVFGSSYTRFKARYAIMGGFEGRQVIDYQNLDELKEKFYSIADHVNADDVLDLPDKIDRTLTCELSPSARKIYNELEKEFIADVTDGVIMVSNALDKLLRLAQIAGGYLVYKQHDEVNNPKTPNVIQRIKLNDSSKKMERVIDSSKIDLMIDVLKDLPPEEPVIIFCRFHNEMDRLRTAIEKNFKGTKINYYKDKRTICEVSGRVKTPIDFKEGVWLARDTNTLIAQIQAAGEGIDLTAARYNFYFSMGFSLAQYQQSRRRTRRPGQNRKVFYYHIIAAGTVDRKIMRAIKAKREIVNSVLDQTKGKEAATNGISAAQRVIN